MEIKVLKDIMELNKVTADEIKEILKSKKIFMVDMMSSPGSGKTTLNDKIIEKLKDKYKIAVIEGDIKTTRDAERLAKHGIQIIQIETDRFRRDCHLEGSWIKKCFESFDLDNLDFIIIENIGNLVCPAEFQLGDDERIVVLSVTEGEDKPAKYPLAFSTSHTMILNKVDLLPHLDYDMNIVMDDLKKINPEIRIFETSAKTGDGMDELVEYLSSRIEEKKQG